LIAVTTGELPELPCELLVPGEPVEPGLELVGADGIVFVVPTGTTGDVGMVGAEGKLGGVMLAGTVIGLEKTGLITGAEDVADIPGSAVITESTVRGKSPKELTIDGADGVDRALLSCPTLVDEDTLAAELPAMPSTVVPLPANAPAEGDVALAEDPPVLPPDPVFWLAAAAPAALDWPTTIQGFFGHVTSRLTLARLSETLGVIRVLSLLGLNS
jgi:hypothetical protein